MKKITSFLLMMVMCCISAFAQFENALITVTDLSQLKDDAVYTIHSERTFLFYSDACPNVIATGNGKLVGNVTWNPFDEDQQFKIIKKEEKFYLYSVGAQMYVNDGGNYGVAPETEFKIMPSIVGESYPWFLGLGSNFLNSQAAGQTDNGLAINTWGSNQEEHEDAGNHYNIFEVDMNAFDPYDVAFQALANAYTSIDAELVANLQEGNNVGTKRGNYIPEYVDAFFAMLEKVDAFMLAYEYGGDYGDPLAICPTAEDVEKLAEDLLKAYNDVLNNKVPLAITGIEPGYYTINSSFNWFTETTTRDTLFYTQEEADAFNAESGKLEGEEGYIVAGDIKEVKSTTTRTPQPSKAIFAYMNGEKYYAAYANLEASASFLWKVEAVEGKPTEYHVTNVATGDALNVFRNDGYIYALASEDTVNVCFDWVSDSISTTYLEDGEEKVRKGMAFAIRNSKDKENISSRIYAHCNGHNDGQGNSGYLVGWSGDAGVSQWYLNPIDEATAEEWINGPAAQLAALIAKGDSIANAFPTQLEVAKDLKNVVDANKFTSPYHCPAEGSIAALFDGSKSTFWHSNWQSGNAYMMSQTTGTNYFVVENAEGLIKDFLAITVSRRAVANDHVTQFTVYGGNEYDAAADLAALKAGSESPYEFTEIGVFDLPYGNNTETLNSDTIELTETYKYFKFVATATSTDRGYFHMSEFGITTNAEEADLKRYETTQYDARKAEADALAAAIAAWEEKEYSKDSLHLLNDEEFHSIYSTLITAAEAWGKVYVDPTALREAIDAAPAENLFVIGNNPGQWKEGVVTPTKVVADATAYNASGAYTPAESEAYLAAIAKAEEDVWAAANKIETGKWYRFSFPTKEMFDTYGWDKANIGATINKYDIETAPSLLGKTLAVGKTLTTYVPYINDEGNEDTVTVYSVETTEEWFNGDNLGFFEEEFTEGEDLFQFIQATDSSYIIQNKATGLFVRGGRPMTLSAIPSYFSSNQPLGAGGNAIAYTNVLGEAESAHVYMHAEQQTQLLTAWQDKSALKTMMMIEEVEAVNDVPTTEYTTKLWPGKVYTYTMPVDVKVLDGATAYGAELSMEENDTCVVLKAIEAETIKAGTPFLMITNNAADYITTADRLKQIASDILTDAGQYGKNEQLQAQALLDGEYELVTMDHGMEVDTVVTELLGLRGTMKAVTVAPGKAVVANENGFAHVRLQTSMAAYSAWIPTDFDPKSADVLSTLEIKIEGSVDTGISEVLDKVAKSGNIYNAAGQLVGKGNINTVNNLPAGIYIVNGVKVTKK